jgi:hypothetical protein
MIKQGIVAGGIAAAAPIVTTFNVPALAAASLNSYRFWYSIPTIGSPTIQNAGSSPCTAAAGWGTATNGTVEDASALGLTVTSELDLVRSQVTLSFASDTPNDFDFTVAGIRYDTTLLTNCDDGAETVITDGGNTATITQPLLADTTNVYFVVTRQPG